MEEYQKKVTEFGGSLKKLEGKLQKWYNRTRPRYIDLVGDFGGRELFIIEGDSLLFSFFFDPKTHWLDLTDPTGGSQFLGVTYLVEKFLSNLLDRHCAFYLVFFEAHKFIWRENSKFLVVRQAVIEHLKANANEVTLIEFKDWWGEVWNEFLDIRQPLFVLLDDGQQNTPAYQKSSDQSSSNDVKLIAKRLVCFCQAFMFSCITKDVSIALLPGLLFKDSCVFAFVFDRIGYFLSKQECTNLEEEIRKVLPTYVPIPISSIDIPKEVPAIHQLKSSGNQRMFYIILSVHHILLNQWFPEGVIKAFIYHALLLDYLPLKARAQKPLTFTPPEVVSFLDEFYKCAQLFMNSHWQRQAETFKLACNLGDFIDARLYAVLVSLSEHDLTLPSEIQENAETTLDILYQHCQSKIHSSLPGSSVVIPSPSTSRDTNGLLELRLFPFKFPFYEKYLDNLNLNSNEVDAIDGEIDYGRYGQNGNAEYVDEYHWHVKKSLNEITIRNDSRLRDYQKYVRFMQSYATSLGTTHNQTITVDRKKSKNQKDARQSEQQAKKKGKQAIKANKVGNKAKAIIEANKEKNLEKVAADSQRVLGTWSAEIDRLKGTGEKLKRLSGLLKNPEKLKHPPTMMKMQLIKLQLQVQFWADELNKDNRDGRTDFSKAMDVYRQVFNIFHEFSNILTNEVKQILEKVLDRLGMESSARKLREFIPKTKTSKSECLFQFPSKPINLPVELSDARFQLKYGGHSMDRDTNAVDDPRIKTFRPDPWQVEVLDIIDRKESALVCCPTSSGKTFIAFYAMEQILREDDKGIIVYVAPTKALVNQITAEVYGRFTKNYPNGSGMSHWGIYTRDYRENHDNCQILITVPEMLEILMLSPNRSDDWSPKIRRIIFDEIHSIGEADGGVVWEHLLLLSQCPILALSATVGNPDEFHSWVEKAQKLRGIKMRLIKSDKRYSELMKFAYIPSLPLPPFETVYPKPTDCFIPVHPCSALSWVILKEKGFPTDMKILPDECLQLYDKMCDVSSGGDQKMLNRLNPDNWFRNKIPITKADASEYEKAIKEAFRNWTMDDGKMQFVKQIISYFRNLQESQFSKLECGFLPEANEFHVGIKQGKFDMYDDDFLEYSILNLAAELNSQDKLPAIFFHFDRHGCNKLALKIFGTLESREAKIRENDEEYQTRKKKAISQTEAREKFSKKMSESKKKKGRRNKDDNEVADLTVYDDEPEIFDWEKNDPRFSFVPPNSSITDEEVEELIKRQRRGHDKNSFWKALKRGIGVHHGGMPKKYLQTVEILFRKKYVRVVIATGTLALGINMPCKTVIFAGDSVFLTALNYRRVLMLLIRRSGRRGFDPVGNVIFFGLTRTKISRLLVSDLPKLSGHFPLTTTMVLRSLLLLTQSTNTNYAEEAIKGFLGNSFFCLGKEHLSTQIKHHLYFSIQYLIRENLLNYKGQLLNLAGAVYHLYYTEPSNFAFAVLYKHGVFHEICSTVNENSQDVKDTLMLVLCNLFNVKPLRPLDTCFSELRKKYPSKIVLDPIPEPIQRILNAHNDRVLQIYSTYIISFSKTIHEPDNKLPLSRSQFPPKLTNLDHLAGQLMQTCVSFTARSSFMAIVSGQGDCFNNVYDLASHLRSNIFLDAHSIPFVETNRHLNAYLLDFFSHGQEKALTEANGIRPGEVWQCLKDFSLILSTICVSLETMDGMDENVLSGFTMVRDHFNDKFKEIWA
ncbi:503_t:CDS:2 [Ambispora gerdemannii]|uniref:503_t:CDS:1 n=1 Tax=Ambispora gerdemannii TaxID=144530 RepID=A0A9N9GKM9_9GLOM|nr:503_t:CDS:2 [Ambispora gerdemannii]